MDYLRPILPLVLSLSLLYAKFKWAGLLEIKFLRFGYNDGKVGVYFLKGLGAYFFNKEFHSGYTIVFDFFLFFCCS